MPVTHSVNMREIAKKRIVTIKTLMDAEDYESAAYIIGLTGEIALKAAICKRLNLASYPPSSTTKNQRAYLLTHSHDELLVLSGLSSVFDPSTGTPEAQNWSDYTTYYRGDWIASLRYNDIGSGRPATITKGNIIHLYDVLINDEHSIINYIKNKRLW